MSLPPAQDDLYASEEDSDFAPEEAPDAASSTSNDENDETSEKPASAKRKHPDGHDATDAGFENSGDEAVIVKGRKKRRKKNPHDEAVAADIRGDEGGEDGFVIKTRSMRATETMERRQAASRGPVTVDVDEIWTEMMNGSATVASSASLDQTRSSLHAEAVAPGETAPSNQPVAYDARTASLDMMRIKRTYNFAGTVHTEEKFVPRHSAEAKLYLASDGDGAGVDGESNQDASSSTAPKRMPRKAFRSAFEPITEQMLPRADLDLGLAGRLRARELASHAHAKKLNTVEKSRMDWAGFVDKEGIQEELALAGKSKHSFAVRQDFLARSDARREQDAYKARMAKRALANKT